MRVGLRRLLLIIVVIAGLGAVWVFVPAVQHKVLGFLHAAKEDIGPAEGDATMGAELKVFLPRTDRCYHRRGCPKITGQGVPRPLVQAKALARPCSHCKPPE